MKNLVLILILGFIAPVFLNDATGANKVNIMLTSDAPAPVRKAADELLTYLKGIYPSYSFTIGSTANEQDYTIRLSLTSQYNDTKLSGEVPVQEEGFLIRQLNSTNVVILSKTSVGLFNAVYTLLEKLGCGFYLSYEVKAAPRSVLDFKEWEMSNFPLQPDRIVFDWHNFLSGCTGWSYEDWCSWIDQSAKMKYNTIMVHAYGNNPMFSFEYNGIRKNVGYLTTSISGRDWGAQHINDIRRLPGGNIFSVPVLGSPAALVSEDRRGEAATDLMSRVFKHAAQRAIKVNFAVDVDTWSANPQNIIKTLPQESRINLGKEDIVNPETADGYRYYKAQVSNLLACYPQITTLTVWVRSDGSLWLTIKPSNFPKTWLNEWNALVAKYPGIEKEKYGASNFAFSKVVVAYQKALKELNREDINIAFGSWNWDYLPTAEKVMPRNCAFIPLDWRIDFNTDATKAILREAGSKRKLIPIVWAHHDDHRYMGKPYTPYPNFNDMLKERNASGFGIIHWTTRPLDLYFKSLGNQVWSSTANKSIASELSEYSTKVFGSRDKNLNEYLTEWLEHGPMFGRETTDHYFDLGRQAIGDKLESVSVTLDGIKKRMSILEKVNPASLSLFGRKMFAYCSGMEEFYLSLFQNQEKFNKAYAFLASPNGIDSARAILQTVNPEKTISLYAAASNKLPITSGEKALIVSMGTRWLPDFLNLKQRAGMTPIRYKFSITRHDSLAQQPGSSTYFIDQSKNIWSCLGTKELKTGTAGDFNSQVAGVYPENSRTYLAIKAPLNIPLVTIGKNQLTPGKYRIEIKYQAAWDRSDLKLSLLARDEKVNLTVSVKSASGLNTAAADITIDGARKYSLEIDPGNKEQFIANLEILPLN